MVSGDRPGRAPGPRLSPRNQVYNRAALTLGDFVSAWQREYGLTDAETAKILADLAAAKLTYVVLAERIPGDLGKKADEQ